LSNHQTEEGIPLEMSQRRTQAFMKLQKTLLEQKMKFGKRFHQQKEFILSLKR
jgi:hypothetical protein